MLYVGFYMGSLDLLILSCLRCHKYFILLPPLALENNKDSGNVMERTRGTLSVKERDRMCVRNLGRQGTEGRGEEEERIPG